MYNINMQYAISIHIVQKEGFERVIHFFTGKPLKGFVMAIHYSFSSYTHNRVLRNTTSEYIREDRSFRILLE